MKVLLTGAGGQAGYELQRTVPRGWELTATDASQLDITDAGAVQAALEELRPELVINAAAYTAVDKAEAETAAAYAVNADAAGHLAASARDHGARLIHISTDFVFDGDRSSPYRPSDAPHPLGVYGASKLEGERRAMQESGGEALVLRTAWLYSAHGANFVKTMLRLMGEKERLGVVADQVGSPTWAHTLAEAVWAAAARPQLKGVYHWSDAGVASWYDFAVAIQEEALALGLLRRTIPIAPLTTADYPTPARRPVYSVLDKGDSWRDLDLTGRHWRACLRDMLEEMTHA